MKIIKLINFFNLLILISGLILLNSLGLKVIPKFNEEYGKIEQIKLELLFANKSNIESVLYNIYNLHGDYDFKSILLYKREVVCEFIKNNPDNYMIVNLIKKEKTPDLCKIKNH